MHKGNNRWGVVEVADGGGSGRALRGTYIKDILRAGQCTSRLEGNKLVSNRTNLIRVSIKYHPKYNRVVSVLSGKPIS